MTPVRRLFVLLLGIGLGWGGHAQAQQLDLSHGGPIDITSTDGIEWRQAEQQVIARGNARAVRGNVTVSADRLIAWYRKKGSTETAGKGAADKAASDGPHPPQGQLQRSARQTGSNQAAGATGGGISGLAADPSGEETEIYRLQAEGNVLIFTQTDRAQGDRAIYDLDHTVLVLTGRSLKLTTPNNVLSARDDLEYWPQKHMAVARGQAVVVTNDAKRVAADTLVAYTQDAPVPAAATGVSGGVTRAAQSSDDPLVSSGKLDRVEAFDHVSVRTTTDTVTADRGVYVPNTGMARLAGNVQITRGQNQLNGAEADVNMKTGIARLIANSAGRVHGLVMPNDQSSKALTSSPATAPKGASGSADPPNVPSGPAGSRP